MSTTLRPGDRVALLVPGSPDYLDVVIGLLARGVVPIPLDPRLTTYERDRILAGLSPTLIVTSAAELTELRSAYPDVRALPRAGRYNCLKVAAGGSAWRARPGGQSRWR